MIIYLVQANIRRYSVGMKKSGMLTVQEFRLRFGEESQCAAQLSGQSVGLKGFAVHAARGRVAVISRRGGCMSVRGVRTSAR